MDKKEIGFVLGAALGYVVGLVTAIIL